MNLMDILTFILDVHVGTDFSFQGAKNEILYVPYDSSVSIFFVVLAWY